MRRGMRYAARRTSIDGHHLALAAHTHSCLPAGRGARRCADCAARPAQPAVLRHRSTIPTQPVFSKLSIDGQTPVDVTDGPVRLCADLLMLEPVGWIGRGPTAL